jgi:putative transposase
MRDMDTGYHLLRKGRHSIDGQIYLITFNTDQRKPIFAERRLATNAVSSTLDPANWQTCELLTWVLMPNHWHGLIRLHGTSTLAGCIGALKGRSARRLRLHYPKLGRIWQDGFHDHAVRREEDLVQLARYIVLNPVRAGLVQRVAEYPYWDSVWRPDRT